MRTFLAVSALLTFAVARRSRSRNEFDGDCLDEASALIMGSYRECCMEDGRPGWCDTDVDCATTDGKRVDDSDKWDQIVVGNCCATPGVEASQWCPTLGSDSSSDGDSDDTSDGTSDDSSSDDEKRGGRSRKEKVKKKFACKWAKWGESRGAGPFDTCAKLDADEQGVGEAGDKIARRTCELGIANPDAKCFK